MPKGQKYVLLVDDDVAIQDLVSALLEDAGFDVRIAQTGAGALSFYRSGFSGVVVLDLMLPDTNGHELFPKLRRIRNENPVVFLTGHGSTQLALETIREGAFDFVDKRNLAARLVPVVASAFAQWQHNASDVIEGFEHIITRSRAMFAVFRAVSNVVSSELPVLLRGESGTGKELVAQAIHQTSNRSKGQFVGVNCGGIPDNLLEAEMFGYERGAFTGATQRKPGRFDEAQGGTLLLDEIGELPMALQTKLLRVLQEREYRRLGGSQTIRANVRVISSTHRNLEAMVRQGTFREDLYYRLAVFSVSLPPLRERSGDVPVLVRHFTAIASSRERKRITGVDERAMEILASFHYPGNVRQLENIVNYAVVSARTEVISIADLPAELLDEVSEGRMTAGGEPAVEASSAAAALVYTDANFPTLKALEAEHVTRALELAQGNRAKAARLLGVSRMTLYRKIDTSEDNETS